MTYEELKNYILNYIKNDKTQSAIMLNGDWGTGKSYFIENELIPFIDENTEKDTVVISLYGLSSINELCKAIFCELKFSSLNKSKGSVKLIINTAIKGMASYWNLDLNISPEEFKELFESIDLSKTFMIFEDVERTEIPISKLMGYINNMVERDNAKILIVANETEMIKKEYNDDDEEVDTEGEEKYFKIKEKTITDTINFDCDIKAAIGGIIRQFSDALAMFDTEGKINHIHNIMMLEESYNLRTFIFACQKSSDLIKIINFTELEAPESFRENIFFSIIAFSYKIKMGKSIKWSGDDNMCYDLGYNKYGNKKYPLFKFCYDYILYQKLVDTDFIKLSKKLNNIRIYDTDVYKSDDDLKILNYWYLYDEVTVKKSIERIYDRLNDKNRFPVSGYGMLIKLLLKLEEILSEKYDDIYDKIKENLKGEALHIDSEVIFGDDYFVKKEPYYEKYLKIKEEIIESMEYTETKFSNFDYTVDKIENWIEEVNRNEYYYKRNAKFCRDLDIKKFVSLFLLCNPMWMYRIRETFKMLFYNNLIGTNFSYEIETLTSISDQLTDIKDNNKLDNIQNKIREIFINDLNRYSEKLKSIQ